MPVITRSKSLPDGYIRAYKIVNKVYSPQSELIVPIVAVLIIPNGVNTTMAREIFGGNPDYCKYRSECAFVENFLDLTEKPLANVLEAYSWYMPSKSFVYRRGQFIYPDHFHSNIEKICGGGIHFFKTIQGAIAYYILSSNKKYIQKKVLCPGHVLPYDIKKNFIGDGIYSVKNDNGHWMHTVEYKQNMIRMYKTNKNNIMHTTKFYYNSNNTEVKTETILENCESDTKYTTVFKID